MAASPPPESPQPLPPPPRPFPSTYWVVPGRFLAGEYPGSFDPAALAERLEAFLDAGITFFLDLTEEGELEAYAEALAELAEERGTEVRHVRFPIADHRVPRRREDMVAILDAIDEALAAGECLYVHCFGGIGRTGTVVGCHLARLGFRGEAALDTLQRLWVQSIKRSFFPSIPETEVQRRWVLEWEEEA